MGRQPWLLCATIGLTTMVVGFVLRIVYIDDAYNVGIYSTTTLVSRHVNLQPERELTYCDTAVHTALTVCLFGISVYDDHSSCCNPWT